MSSKELIVNDSKESELMHIIKGEKFEKISGHISDCITAINEQKSNAENAKNLTGRFKGQLRDNALADALIASADTQNKTITLIQESIKLFFYCLRCQDETNSLHKEELVNLITEQSDNPETNEYLNEILSGIVSYRDANNTKIKAIKDDQDEKILCLKEQIRSLNERVNKHDGKFQELDSKVSANNDRLTKLEMLRVKERLAAIEKLNLEENLSETDNKISHIKEDIDKHNDRLLEIENLNLKECLSNQQRRIEILENITNEVKAENECLRKTLFWYKILALLSVVLVIISFFIK